ncbi:MAG: hypothetical protein IJ456_00730 [Bacteroides sp.]|nr:hypothetical protein [Bacteroides sp.]
MKLSKNIMLSFFVLSSFTCCQNEDELIGNQDESMNGYKLEVKNTPSRSSSETEQVSDIIRFSYKGVTYTSECLYGDTLYIKDQYVRSVFKEANNQPNIAIAVNADGSIDFFDTVEEVYAKHEASTAWPAITTSTDGEYIQEFKIRVYEDAKGRSKGGRYMEFYSTGIQGNKTPPNLSVSGDHLYEHYFNNVISSCQMWGTINAAYFPTSEHKKNASVTFFDNNNFTGKSLTFNDINPDKTYSERDYFSSFDFNDLTSSFVVVYH